MWQPKYLMNSKSIQEQLRLLNTSGKNETLIYFHTELLFLVLLIIITLMLDRIISILSNWHFRAQIYLCFNRNKTPRNKNF